MIRSLRRLCIGLERGSLVAALCAVLALIAGRTRVHLCEGDAQLYRVVARGLAERGEWLNLSYLPSVHPQFREHLPFGLWPTVAAIRLFGEAALPWLDGLWSALILLTVAVVARRLWGERGGWSAAGAIWVLGLTDNFSHYCALPRLDGPLVLFSLLSVAPLLTGRVRWSGWLLSTIATALACAVKGPFGLIPLLAVGGARLCIERSPRWFFQISAASAIASLPVLAFLLWQREWGDVSWWSGYVQRQLLASSVGTRADGHGGFFYPWAVAGRHFWPGLLLIPFAGVRAFRDRDPRRWVLGLALLLGLIALGLPQRKLAHHLVVLYPLAAIFCGERLGVLLARWPGSGPWLEAGRRIVLPALSVLLWGAVAVGRPFWLQSARCLSQGALSGALDRLSLTPGTPLWMVSAVPDWQGIASLAADRRLEPWPIARPPAMDGSPIAYALSASTVQLSAGWRELASGDGWTLWDRSPFP